jgi:hypothetical protein
VNSEQATAPGCTVSLAATLAALRVWGHIYGHTSARSSLWEFIEPLPCSCVTPGFATMMKGIASAVWSTCVRVERVSERRRTHAPWRRVIQTARRHRVAGHQGRSTTQFRLY